MTFNHWKAEVGEELAAIFGWSLAAGRDYMKVTDDGQNWREMYNDGLSPEEAASEEALAAAE